jgi:hypothetical protein
MAVPLPPKGTVQVAISGLVGPAEWSVVFHTFEETPSDPSESNVHNIAQGYFDAWITAWIPFQSDQTVLEECNVIHWGTAGAEVTGAYTNPTAGEDAGDVLPASASMLVSERIASHYKGGHPRMYVPGLVVDRMESSQFWSAATVTEAQTAAETFLALVNGVTLGAGNHTLLSCLRRFAGGGSQTIPKTYLDPPTIHTVQGVIARSKIASQRRRLTN